MCISVNILMSVSFICLLVIWGVCMSVCDACLPIFLFLLAACLFFSLSLLNFVCCFVGGGLILWEGQYGS